MCIIPPHSWAALEPGISPCQTPGSAPVTGSIISPTISRLSVFVLPLPPPVPAQDCQCHNSSSTHLKAHFKTINLTLEEVLFVPESLPRYVGVGELQDRD